MGQSSPRAISAMSTTPYLALLNAIRQRTGDSQAKLAARLNVSQVTVGRWLRKKDEPAHKQRLQIELVARDLGVLDDGDGTGVPVVGFISSDGTVRWADTRGRDAVMESTSPQFRLVYEGPPSFDGFIQPGCEIVFESVQFAPDETVYGKPCVMHAADGQILVGTLRSKTSTSKRDNSYQVQLIGSGRIITAKLENISLIRRITPSP